MTIGSCKNICKEYKNSTPLSAGYYIASPANKRCSTCSIFIKWEGLWCPCCGYRLRGKPRAAKNKRKYLEGTIERY